MTQKHCVGRGTECHRGPAFSISVKTLITMPCPISVSKFDPGSVLHSSLLAHACPGRRKVMPQGVGRYHYPVGHWD